MSPTTPQTTREQRARAYLETIGFYRTWMDGSQRFDMDRPMYLLTKLLASTEQRVLEEAIEKIGKRIDWYSNTRGVDILTRAIQINEAEHCIEVLRQQAQERTP